MKLKKIRNIQEKCNREKRIISILMIIMLLSCYLNPVSAFAKTYNGQKAADYARQYALNPNSSYYDFGKVDCTNFVSQCVVAGGYSMCVNNDFKSKPNILKKYICDNGERFWYMKKVKRKVGYDYWQYSKSWSTVGGFYNYCMYHNGTAIIKKYDVSNKKSLESLKKSANVGDVLQINGNKEQHSIIVTQKKNNTLYYSGHSAGRDNEIIDKFIEDAKRNKDKIVIRIQFVG